MLFQGLVGIMPKLSAKIIQIIRKQAEIRHPRKEEGPYPEKVSIFLEFKDSKQKFVCD